MSGTNSLPTQYPILYLKQNKTRIYAERPCLGKRLHFPDSPAWIHNIMFWKLISEQSFQILVNIYRLCMCTYISNRKKRNIPSLNRFMM